MAAHVDVEGECPLAVIPCKYHDIGCKVKVSMNCRITIIILVMCICHYINNELIICLCSAYSGLLYVYIF